MWNEDGEVIRNYEKWSWCYNCFDKVLMEYGFDGGENYIWKELFVIFFFC